MIENERTAFLTQDYEEKLTFAVSIRVITVNFEVRFKTW